MHARIWRTLAHHVGCGISVFILLLGATTLAACASGSHRDQVIFISEEKEMEMGAAAYQEELNAPNTRLSGNLAEIEPVERVMTHIIDAAKSSEYVDRARRYDWQVSVVKDDQNVNVSALPGGKIIVHTGVFSVAKNEAGLGWFLGRAAAHALLRHGAEKMSTQILGNLVTAGTAIDAGERRNIDHALAPELVAKQRAEADYWGLLLMAKAGYDPREAVAVLWRMGQFLEGPSADKTETSGGYSVRIKQIQGWMDEALSNYNPPPGFQVRDLPTASSL